MANICDNHLELFCKAIPSWFVKDPDVQSQWGGISIVSEPRYLFIYNDFESLTCEKQDDGTYFIEFWFETKWAPPENLYEVLIEDDNIISFNAVWYEPGCGVLGYANKEEGIQHEDAPDRYYSDFLDLDILKDEPPQSYIETNGDDSWVTFEKYKELMQEKLAESSTEDKVIIVDEVKEMTEYFSDEQSE